MYRKIIVLGLLVVFAREREEGIPSQRGIPFWLGRGESATASETPPPHPEIYPLPSSSPLSLEEHPLFQQAQKANPQRVRFALEKGARFLPTPDGRSFLLLWTPPGFEKATSRSLMVTLHGHASWAYDEFFLWYPFVVKRGYGILALQWWFGKGESPQDYYSPQAMYRIVEEKLQELGIQSENVLLHGYSRGAANTYALTALDRQRSRFFLLTIANAGGAAEDFPPNRDICEGRFGPQPFQDVHWVLYAGGKDPHPERDGIPAMERTRAFVARYGGKVDLFIQDPHGEHGGFHRTPQHVEKALDLFDQLRFASQGKGKSMPRSRPSP